MMRPLSLYLTEFRPADPARVALPPLPDLIEEGRPFAPATSDRDSVACEALPLAFAAEPLALLEPPVAPAPDLEAALAAQAADHEAALQAALAAARNTWVMEEGAALAARITDAFAGLEDRLAAALAPLLEPFLDKAARSKALGQLRETLTTLLDGADGRAVEVSGPADLLGVLRDRVGDRPGLAFNESEASDVTIALGDTRIRSQLRAWTRKLETALEPQA